MRIIEDRLLAGFKIDYGKAAKSRLITSVRGLIGAAAIRPAVGNTIKDGIQINYSGRCASGRYKSENSAHEKIYIRNISKYLNVKAVVFTGNASGGILRRLHCNDTFIGKRCLKPV